MNQIKPMVKATALGVFFMALSAIAIALVLFPFWTFSVYGPSWQFAGATALLIFILGTVTAW